MVDADEAMKRAASEVDWLRGHSILSSGSVLVAAMIKSLESSGWVCVPREATEEMEECGWIDKEDVTPSEIYGRMIDAAPRLTGEKR